MATHAVSGGQFQLNHHCVSCSYAPAACRTIRHHTWLHGATHNRRIDPCTPLCRAAAPLARRSAEGIQLSPALEPKARTTYDCISLGNLCVDVVLQVDDLPPKDIESRKALLQQLTQSPPDISTWEVGGACNFMLAARRLGLRVGCVGQLGSNDNPGNFLRNVLQEEGIPVVVPVLPAGQQLAQTLLCFVLVAQDAHMFCSAYDFGPWPLLAGTLETPPPVLQMLRDTRALYLNGFVFDELEPQLVVTMARTAREAGAAVFFDPGPRCWTLLQGDRRQAFESLVSVSDVVLLTQDEATTLSGHHDPDAAARWLLQLPDSGTSWVIIKAGGDGATLYARDEGRPAFSADAYEVNVRDTVGCGDSFAAAVVLGYLAGHSIPTVMALANAVGAATAMGTGAGRNVAAVGDVKDLLLSSIDSSEEDPCVHRRALQLLQSSTSGTDDPPLAQTQS